MKERRLRKAALNRAWPQYAPRAAGWKYEPQFRCQMLAPSYHHRHPHLAFFTTHTRRSKAVTRGASSSSSRYTSSRRQILQSECDRDTSAATSGTQPERALQGAHTITMGGSVSKIMGKIFGSREMRLLMLGLDAAGKTSTSTEVLLCDR